MRLGDEWFSNCCRYEGDWLEGRHHGLGIMLWPNGQKHDGGWLHGEMHGAGMHRWQNGTCREGVWHKGERIEWTGSENFGLVVIFIDSSRTRSSFRFSDSIHCTNCLRPSNF
jgi:hypothetical protein